MPTRLQINCVPDVTAYSKLELLHKMMMSLHCSSNTITQGWPSNIKAVSSVIQSYWTFREKLTIEFGIILKGTRIVMPAKKQESCFKA